MVASYHKPPLLEAFCELRFESADDKPWDWTIPGLVYAEIKDTFPVRTEKHAILLPIKAPVQLAAPTLDRVHFSTAQKDALVQIGRDLFAVNSLRPHMGWQKLRKTTLDVLALYRRVAQPRRLVSAAVRYINRADVPAPQGGAMNAYLGVLPVLPAGIPPQVTAFMNMTEIAFEQPSTRLRFRFATAESAAEDEVAFILDYELLSDPESPPEFANLGDWLDSAHDRITQAFRGSFTPEAHRDLFAEVST